MGAGPHPEPPDGILSKERALVMVGPPGAGKGTQSHALAREFKLPEISTGFMLRDAVRRKTPLGIAAQAAMESGVLVPDELVCKLVERRISEPNCARGFIVDGFPRNLNQALFLDQTLRLKGRIRVLALNIQVDQETLLKRLAGRRICPVCGTTYNIFFGPSRKEGFCDKEGSPLIQRPDDHEDVIRRRLEEYERQTQPLVDHYRRLGLLQDVDGNGDAAAVTAAIFAILKAS